MMYVLIGFGPNDVDIPALVWSNKEAALAECIDILGDKYRTIDEGVSFSWTAEDNGFPKEITSQLYTHYYGGCGECYCAKLVPVEEGKPFAGWNLD